MFFTKAIGDSKDYTRSAPCYQFKRNCKGFYDVSDKE